jgi:RNA polymerase sigma factor (TIGR02999 family)
MSDVTRILTAMKEGDGEAAAQLLPLVYHELRRLAAHKMAQEKPGQTLQATALVHEAYLRLVDVSLTPHWDSRGHFFAAAAEAMRRILVEMARRKRAEKHGGHLNRIEFDTHLIADQEVPLDLLALDTALSELEAHEPTAAELVKLRFFSGLSHQDAASAMGIGRRAADRLWALARAWLYRQIAGR